MTIKAIPYSIRLGPIARSPGRFALRDQFRYLLVIDHSSFTVDRFRFPVLSDRRSRSQEIFSILLQDPQQTPKMAQLRRKLSAATVILRCFGFVQFLGQIEQNREGIRCIEVIVHCCMETCAKDALRFSYAGCHTS